MIAFKGFATSCTENLLVSILLVWARDSGEDREGGEVGILKKTRTLNLVLCLDPLKNLMICFLCEQAVKFLDCRKMKEI